ncbi:hypothetical protein Tco_0801146 [Tanacetum coccineum]|uniref:Calreticulin n=1 Tax=Tanacetum coccineum TaxID=301880 RepID=A0ABQ4ZZI3_9ASTR
MDRYTKNALWLYRKRGNDEEIDVDVVTNDIPGFKTYDEYKDEWIYQWNKGIPCVDEKPWSKNEDPTDNIDHVRKPFRFKSGHSEWL